MLRVQGNRQECEVAPWGYYTMHDLLRNSLSALLDLLLFWKPSHFLRNAVSHGVARILATPDFAIPNGEKRRPLPVRVSLRKLQR